MKKFIAALAAVLFFSGCGGGKNVTKSGFYLNTYISVTVYSAEHERIAEEALALCKEFENLLSRTVPGSDVYNINNSGGEFVEVSVDTLYLIEKGLYYCELTGGRFDITVGALTELWNFSGRSTGTAEPPNEEDISEALKTVGMDNIVVRGNEVMLKNPRTKIDLGGMAKGYVADKIAELFEENGVAGLIDLGGNIVTVGEKPDKKLFSIGIASPFAEGGVFAVLKVPAVSVVTSGDYERSFYHDGVFYHHILDTQTGYPADSEFKSVTVISEKSLDGDALGTGLFSMPLEDALKLANTLEGIDAVFILKDGEIEFTPGTADKYAAELK